MIAGNPSMEPPTRKPNPITKPTVHGPTTHTGAVTDSHLSSPAPSAITQALMPSVALEMLSDLIRLPILPVLCTVQKVKAVEPSNVKSMATHFSAPHLNPLDKSAVAPSSQPVTPTQAVGPQGVNLWYIDSPALRQPPGDRQTAPTYTI